MRSIKKVSILISLFFASVLLPIKAYAFCPLCAVATGFFLGIFRWLGVDDTIIGLWIGAFIFSVSILFNNYLIRKNRKIPFQIFFVVLSSYLVTISALLLTNSINPFNPYNNILGINKIIFGMILGSLTLLITPKLNNLLKEQNEGKNFISHQKVIAAVGLLLIISLGFYFLIQ